MRYAPAQNVVRSRTFMPANGCAGSVPAPPNADSVVDARTARAPEPRRGPGRQRPGVLDSRNGAPGLRNDQSVTASIDEEPRSGYCGQSRTVAPSLTGAAGMRIAWLSSTMSATVWSDEPRLGLLEEFGTLGSAEHDRDLLLAVLGQPEHRAHVQPVLPRQTVDSEPAVGGADDAQHRRRSGVGGHPEVLHLLGQQHRIRKRRQQRLEHRHVDLDDASCVGGRLLNAVSAAERGVAAGDVLGDPSRRPAPAADPDRCC